MNEYKSAQWLKQSDTKIDMFPFKNKQFNYYTGWGKNNATLKFKIQLLMHQTDRNTF